MQMSSQLQFLLRLLNVDEYYIHLCNIVFFSIINLINSKIINCNKQNGVQ